MKYLLLLVFVFATENRCVAARYTPPNKQDDRVIKLIAALPEVISLQRTMLKHNGRPLVFAIDSEPTKRDPYFKVAVSEDMVDHHFMYYRFCVNAKTYTISYYDTIKGKRISLKVWRKYGRKI